jgi:two-component system, cell cycle sensor histidine kinase and response regulator CckA
MSYHITRALRIALLAMAIALIFKITIKTLSLHGSIWGLPIHAILFIVNSAFVVSIVMLLREKKSRSVLTHEIEHRRGVEQQLHLQAAALESAANAIVITDRDSTIVWVNPAFSKLTGYSAEEVLGKTPRILKSGHHEPGFYKGMWQQLMSGSVWHGDLFNRRKDGSLYLEEATITPVRATGGDISHFIAIKVDITERNRAEQELRESEERFRQAVEGSPIGMYIQTDGIFRYFNPAALAIFGADSASQIIGRGYLDIIHPDTRAAVIDRARLVLEKREAVPFLEERLLRLDGTVFDGEVTAIPFIFEGRGGALVFVRDISERKRNEGEKRGLELQLRQAQKMEAVGRLAGGIAHDFNNLLMVIQSYTEMLQDRLPVDDGLRKNTEQVLKAAHRAASLTGQMLAFSRKQITAPVVLDLNSVIDDTAKMLKRLIGEDIEVQVTPAESLWTISADADQIVQVLMNLCVNARDAMPQGGMLTIATENIAITEGSINGHPEVAPGEYVKLTVSDSGLGIRKEDQEQIFEPFYTTKDVGKGTGLGLAMVYGIVKQNGGNVWVDSELGQGACFTICLPRAKGMIASDTSAKPARQRRGTGTILIAEDEEALREAICGYLRTLGYMVLEASSGQEALSVASEHEGHIDLLITDVVMPKMSGRELSQTLGRSRPRLKTIHMSGYTDDAVLRHGIQGSEATFLQKPFNLSMLARTVSDTLGQSETVQ